ncbi:MAG: DnaJ domain-containing protein [Candidatus Gracilibacteria bacterium]|nr:DnaJ domain-containing protein [Candidatus Gracilibacteria bacterium]
MNLYEVLGVEKNATKDEIKKAYRKAAMKHHPDRNSGDAAAEKKFKDVNEAYSTLYDDAKRQQYDMFGSTGGAAGAGGNPFGGGFSGNANVDFGDIFDSFFGGNGQSRGRGQRRTEQKGEDLEYQLHIDLKTSIYGGKETLKFKKRESCNTCDGAGGKGKKSCNKCHGTGQCTYTTQSIFGTIQQTATCDECRGSGESFETVCGDCHGEKRSVVTKEIEIDIPAGIDHGMVIKMTDEGNHGVNTNAHGDLYIKFTVPQEEKGLSRDDVNLYYHVEVDIIEAILGTNKEIVIPILGKRNISIKSGTQYGSIIKLENDGVQHINSDEKGDLFITIEVKIPKKLSKAERTHYESIASEKKINVNKGGVFEKIFK